MLKLDKILAMRGGEGQGTALDCAMRLAVKSNSRLTVADVLENLPPSLQAISSFLDLWNRAALEEERELKDILGALAQKGVNAEARVLVGTPFIEIIKEAVGSGHDLVVKGSEGTGRMERVFLGSNDMHLLRKCPCPVLIVKPSASCDFKRIMAAVDPDPHNNEKTALNLKVIDAAATLARAWDGTLHIVHAWELLSESLIRVRNLVSSQDLETYLNETHALRKKWTKELLERSDLEGVDHSAAFLKGNPWEIIPAVQKERKIGLVVMGTVARTGLPGLLIGNTAEKILNRINCSVLAVKPDGFVSPVAP